MAEWQDQLNTILSDPEAMAQIASLAQSLSGAHPDQTGTEGPAQAGPSRAGPAQADPARADPAHTDPAQADPAHAGPARADPARAGAARADDSAPDPMSMLAALGGLDPALLRRFSPLLQQLDRPESRETTALLMALRPFLSEKRRGKVERAAQLARLIHLGKVFMTSGQEGPGRV